MSNRNHLCIFMNTLIDAGVEFRVCLRGAPQLLGPAKVERVDVEQPNTSSGTKLQPIRLYRMIFPASPASPFIQQPDGAWTFSGPMPIVFDGADVLMIIEPPLNVRDKAT